METGRFFVFKMIRKNEIFYGVCFTTLEIFKNKKFGLRENPYIGNPIVNKVVYYGCCGIEMNGSGADATRICVLVERNEFSGKIYETESLGFNEGQKVDVFKPLA